MSAPTARTAQDDGAARDRSLESLHAVDPGHPRPRVTAALTAPENAHLLDFVTEDPFGAHVFPGTIPGHPVEAFLEDLAAQLASSPGPIHLWCYIPTCPYRCRFCQYPTVLAKGPPEDVRRKVTEWARRTVAEARLWLRRLPVLRTAPVGEFNVFGGTPSLLPPGVLGDLLDFFRAEFGFTPETTVRFEGDPTTLTPGLLAVLAAHGCSKVSCGVQSFDDHVLRQCGRPHTGDDALAYLRAARATGLPWVSIDLIHGLLDQTVDSVDRDLRLALGAGPTAVVCAKLHLRSYAETRTGVSGPTAAAWQFPAHRERLARSGHHWPTLGEQYQMREIIADGLAAAGFDEHPTMYFARRDAGPEKWKSLMVDQGRQEAEVAIGLGGSSSCRASEAITIVDPDAYTRSVEAGVIPLDSATRLDPAGQEARAIKMALTSLHPLSDALHRARFPGRSLFAEPWRARFGSLARRGLLTVDERAGTVALTDAGATLIEAIINTEL